MSTSIIRSRSTAAILLACTVWLFSSPAKAEPPRHHLHSMENFPPGRVGQLQLDRGGPMRGYFQPVKVIVPDGAKVSLAQNGIFEPPSTGSVTAGMLIGQVYRLKVTNIPGLEGEEVFPSIEVVNRLYPPRGMKFKFPIPIQLTQQELYYAMKGNYVTRVIYLEEPTRAVPVSEDPKVQSVFEVGQHEDPLRVADQLGRPMAILRMGSRVPEVNQATGQFTFGMPPIQRYEQKVMQHLDDQGIEPPAAGASDPQTRKVYPRLPISTSRYPVLPAKYR